MTEQSELMSSETLHTLVLQQRLEEGVDKLETLLEARRDAEFLDEFWVSLLKEYEEVMAELQRVA